MAKEWTEDEVVRLTYKVAPIVYKGRSWVGSKYSLDDFVQDAVMHILEKFRAGYLDTDRDDIKPLIYVLLNRFFAYNKYKKAKNDRATSSLHLPAIDTSGDSSKKEMIEMIEDENPSPEEFTKNIDAIGDGEEIILGIIDNLDFEPFKSRKYQYSGEIDGKKIELTEANLAKLFFSGKTLHDILRIYGINVTNSGADSRASFIAHKLKALIKKMSETINALNDREKESVVKYLENIANNEDLIWA